MAIVKSLPGFEVTVVTNGKPLTEYVDSSEPDQDRKTTRYIEAVSDQVFEIHVRAKKGAKIDGDRLRAVIHVDGQYAVAPLLRKTSISSCDYVSVNKGRQVSLDTVEPFCFASIDTAHDKRAFNGEKEKLRNLGSIRVHLDFVRILSLEGKQFEPGNTEDLGIVSEKALATQGRPISHNVKYMSAVKDIQRPTRTTVAVDPSGNSICMIAFYYASKTSLQYAGIIPRTPSPPPLEDKEELTLEEVKQLQAEMKERKEEEVNSKRRKIAHPKAGDTQLALDEGGNFAQQSTAHLGNEKQAPIELSSGEEGSDED